MRKLPIALTVSAFCPYLILSVGFRVDHLVVYGLAYFMLMRFLIRREKPDKLILAVFIGWFIPVSLIFTRTFMGDHAGLLQMMPDIDNFLQPLAIMLCFLFLVKYTEPKELLHTVCKVSIFILFINAVWTLVQVMGIDTTPINQYFWRGDVAALAATNGRFSGIFNQPVEGGVAYSVGLLAWAYLAHYQKVDTMRIVMMLGMVVGGMLTVSKLFLFGGLPLFIWWMFRQRNLLKVTITSLTVGIFPVYFLMNQWQGRNYLFRFADGNQGSFLEVITAGRFGGEVGTMDILFNRVWDVNPYYGLGMGQSALNDSAYFQMFVNGGLFAFTGYAIFLLIILYIAFTRWRKTPESLLFRCMTLIIVFGGFGAPILSLNRCSVILWCMLCCTLLVMNRETGSFYLR